MLRKIYNNKLHDFSFLIFWHKKSCLYYLGEAAYEK